MVASLILAGGRGSRIGERKALLKLGSRPLISYVIDVALEFSDDVLVATDGADVWDTLRNLVPHRINVVIDVEPGKGPLGGIYSGMRHLVSEYCVVLPCDSPFVRVSVVRYLIAKAEGIDAAVPVWPNGYKEPLHSVYRTSAALKAAEKAIKEGTLRVSNMLEKLDRVSYVPVEALSRLDTKLLTFFNINDLSDLRRAESLLVEVGTSKRP